VNLTANSITVCEAGPFDVDALSAFLPDLEPLMKQHGEQAVVERCQIARVNSHAAHAAIDSVLAFYRGETGLTAKRATRCDALLGQRRRMVALGASPADVVEVERDLRCSFNLSDEQVADTLAALCH
jgi:hypothetical protein